MLCKQDEKAFVCSFCKRFAYHPTCLQLDFKGWDETRVFCIAASVKDFFDFFWQIVEKEVNSFSQRFDFSEVRKTLFDITKCDCSLNKNKVYFEI